MQRILAVLFDFDGVLIDSRKDIACAVNRTLEHFGCAPIAGEMIVSFVGNGAHVLLSKAFAASKAGAGTASANGFGGVNVTVTKTPLVDEEIFQWYKQYYKEHATVYTTLYPGVRELLALLAEKHIALGLVSNKPEEISRTILRHFELERLFGAIVGPESAGKTKPAPDGILCACNRLGVAPEHTLMVGDSDVDVLAARAAGTQSCGFVRGIGNATALVAQSPDFTVEALSQINLLLFPTLQSA